jgi:hypothetical protein
MIVIPTLDSQFTSFTIEIELSGVLYNLIFNWNSRENFWYMSILDVNELPIMTDVKLVLNYDMFLDFQSVENLPSGTFVFVQITPGVELTEFNFGTDYQLTYYTEDEVVEVENASV